MNLTTLEKAAVISTAAAAAFKVLLWSVGATLNSDEPWLDFARWLFGALSFVAFDLTLMAVVADQRTHGRGGWGTITLVAAAGFAALIALHVAEVAAMPALHAGPALLLLFFGLHLSSKRDTTAALTATPDAPDATPAADDAAIAPEMPQLPAPARWGLSVKLKHMSRLPNRALSSCF